MLDAFQLAMRQLTDRRIIILLGKVLFVTFALLAVLGVGLFYLLVWAFDSVFTQPGGFTAAATAALIALVAVVFLVRVVAIFVINIFSDDVVDAVESKYYPKKAEQSKPPSYALGLKMGLASAARALGYNLLASPLYIGLLITGIGTAVAFFAVNAVLIGRDLQDMVASRHITRSGGFPNGDALHLVLL